MCVDSMKTLALDLYHFGIKVLQLMVTVLEIDALMHYTSKDASLLRSARFFFYLLTK